MLYLGLVSIAFVFFPDFLISIFTSDAAVSPTARACLMIFGISFVSYAWGMVFMQAFNGAGDTLTPTVLNFFAFWVLQIPLAWWLAIPLARGPRGAFWAVLSADIFLTITSFVFFRRGKWKLQRI